ncbi:MAG: hypothetical protein HDR51_00335 [Treponema sp.]|nr:hypothetical protein [Treponema sp.]
MSGNLGSIEIDGRLLTTAEHKAVFRSLPIVGGVAYPCGACVSYDSTKKRFKPASFASGKIYVVAKARAADEDASDALCIVHGTVNRDMLRKGIYIEGEFNSWENLTDEDYVQFLENSNIM